MLAWPTSQMGSRFATAPATAPNTLGLPPTTRDVLLQRASAGDCARAIALQDEALVIAHELGMRPLIERALARQQTLNT